MRTLTGQGVPNIDPPDASYPYGRARNSDPPSARNGTPLLETNLMTDCGYAMLAVMKEAGIVPNESAENIDVSQFKTALLSLIGTVPTPNKVIIDAPDLDVSNLNLLCRYSYGLSSNDYNTWLGVSEAIGKLTVQGIVTLKVRNRTAGPVVATKGTSIYAGDSSFFSAGFITVDLNNNTDLLNTKNVVGELAEDFNFTDTTTYFLVDVIIKGKPMVDAFNFWGEDIIAQTVTPTQPGITVFPISSEWDPNYIKDLPRIVFSPNIVFYENPTTGDYNFWKNAAINNLMQIVSTNGENAFTLNVAASGSFTISFYTPAAGPGSLLILDKFWQFNLLGYLTSGGSIILGESDVATNDGEIWYDSAEDKLKGKENGIIDNLIGHEQGCIYTRDNATVTTISGIGEGNKKKFDYFDQLGPNTSKIIPSIPNQDIEIVEDGIYEIILSITPDSVGGPAAAYGFGIYSSSGTVSHDMLHAHRNMAGGGGEFGSVSISGQDSLTAGTKLELYVWNDTNTQDIILADVTFSVKKLRN